MTNKDIYKNLGDINPQIILDAAPGQKAKTTGKKSPWIRWGALAACFVILLCTAPAVRWIFNDTDPGVLPDEGNSNIMEGNENDSIMQGINSNLNEITMSEAMDSKYGFAIPSYIPDGYSNTAAYYEYVQVDSSYQYNPESLEGEYTFEQMTLHYRTLDREYCYLLYFMDETGYKFNDGEKMQVHDIDVLDYTLFMSEMQEDGMLFLKYNEIYIKFFSKEVSEILPVDMEEGYKVIKSIGQNTNDEGAVHGDNIGSSATN